MAMHQQQQVKSFKLGTFSYVKKNKTNSSSPKDVLGENRGEKKTLDSWVSQNQQGDPALQLKL